MATLTIYTIGDLGVVQGVLNGVAMIFSPSQGLLGGTGSLGMGAVIGLGLLISLVFIIAKTMTNMQKGGGFDLPILLVLVIVLYSMTVPKATVQLEDIYSGQVAKVDNVPLGVALPGAIISSFTRIIASKIETAFQTANNSYIPLDDQVFNNPFRMVLSLYNNTASASPYLAWSIRQFIMDCAPSTINKSKLYESSNAIETITSNFNSGLTTFYDKLHPNGVAMSCSEAATSIRDDVNLLTTGSLSSADSTTAASDLVRAASMGASPLPDGTSITYDKVLDSVGMAQYIAGTTTDAQAVTANMALGRTISCAMSCIGNSTSIAEYNTCNANCAGDALIGNAMDQSAIDATASASMFGKMVIPTMNMLLAIFYAFFPIVVMVAAMSAGNGPNLVGKFLLFGVWTQSWLPFAALINAVMQMSTQDGARIINAAYGDGTNLSFGETMLLYEYLRNRAAAASDLLAMTPLISMAVLSGSYYGLTQVANRMSSRDRFDATDVAPDLLKSGPVVQGAALAAATGSPYGWYGGMDRSGMGSVGAFGMSNVGTSMTGIPTINAQAVAENAQSIAFSTTKQAIQEASKTVSRLLEDSATSDKGIDKAIEAGSAVRHVDAHSWELGSRLVDETGIAEGQSNRITDALKSVAALDIALGANGSLIANFVKALGRKGKGSVGGGASTTGTGKVDSSTSFDEAKVTDLMNRLSSAQTDSEGHSSTDSSDHFNSVREVSYAAFRALGVDKNSVDFRSLEKTMDTAQRQMQSSQALKNLFGSQNNINVLDFSRMMRDKSGEFEASSELRNLASQLGISQEEIRFQRANIHGQGIDADNAAIFSAILSKATRDPNAAMEFGKLVRNYVPSTGETNVSGVPGAEVRKEVDQSLTNADFLSDAVATKIKNSEAQAINAAHGAIAGKPFADTAGINALGTPVSAYYNDGKDISNHNNHERIAKIYKDKQEFTADFLRAMQQERVLNDYVNPDLTASLGSDIKQLGNAAPDLMTASGVAGALSALAASPLGDKILSRGGEFIKNLPELAKAAGPRLLSAARFGGVAGLATLPVGAALMNDDQWARVFSAYERGDIVGAIGNFLDESFKATTNMISDVAQTAFDHNAPINRDRLWQGAPLMSDEKWQEVVSAYQSGDNMAAFNALTNGADEALEAYSQTPGYQGGSRSSYPDINAGGSEIPPQGDGVPVIGAQVGQGQPPGASTGIVSFNPPVQGSSPRGQGRP